MPGDIVLEKSGGGEGAPVGRAVLFDEDDLAVTSNFAARVRVADGVDPRFVVYLLSSLYSSGATLRCIKQTTGIQNLDTEAWLQTPVTTHGLDLQRRIADFLKVRVAEVDRIIVARQQQVDAVWALHKSRSAALVTSGSGEWLEGSLRRFLKSEDGRRLPLSSEERSHRSGPYPYYGASGIIDHVDGYLFEGPRVLLSEDGANLLQRSTPIAFVADGQYWVNNHAHILQSEDGAHAFWAARLEALEVSPWVTGSAQPKLTIEAALGLPLSAPADPERRRRIGSEIEVEAEASRRRVAQLSRSVALLIEYKQALITAAVSGELDVTTAVSGMPG